MRYININVSLFLLSFFFLSPFFFSPPGQVDEELVSRLARHSAVELQPIAAFLGGVIAQEVVKVGRQPARTMKKKNKLEEGIRASIS